MGQLLLVVQPEIAGNKQIITASGNGPVELVKFDWIVAASKQTPVAR